MNVERPKRIRRTHTQIFEAAPEAVFPLLCPVREYDWVPGWTVSLVLSQSGIAEADCIFTTPGTSPGPTQSPETEETIWTITRHEPEAFTLEMLMVTPGRTVGKLEIALRRRDGGGTAADVAYGYTSLGPRGDRFLESFTEESFRQKMAAWESQLSHYLATGTMLAA